MSEGGSHMECYYAVSRYQKSVSKSLYRHLCHGKDSGTWNHSVWFITFELYNIVTIYHFI